MVMSEVPGQDGAAGQMVVAPGSRFPASVAHRQAATQRASLFADPPRELAQPQAGAVPAEPARPSLFGTVTGVFRRRPLGVVAVTEEPVARVEPVVAGAEQQRPEPARAAVRAVAGEEMGLDIPTFLRRQSS